jgi:hypothetical protein
MLVDWRLLWGTQNQEDTQRTQQRFQLRSIRPDMALAEREWWMDKNSPQDTGCMRTLLASYILQEYS